MDKLKAEQMRVFLATGGKVLVNTEPTELRIAYREHLQTIYDRATFQDDGAIKLLAHNALAYNTVADYEAKEN
jgi:hypothetical protein